MAYANPSKELVDEIRAIRKDLDYIKAHMVDVDCIMSSDDLKSLRESLGVYKAGKARSLEELEKELK